MIENLKFDVVCNRCKVEIDINISQIDKEGYHLREAFENAVREKGWTYFSDGSQWCPACEQKWHGGSRNDH